MIRYLRAIFQRPEPTAQQVRTRRGVIATLEGRPTRLSRTNESPAAIPMDDGEADVDCSGAAD